MAEVFPIVLRAVETPNWTSSPHEYRDAFREAFLAANPNGYYYAFDVTIHSETEVSFAAYDMRDSFSGGIGHRFWEGSAVVPKVVTKPAIDRAILRAATERREAEIAAAEAEIINRYADETRAAISKATGKPLP